MYRSQSDDTTDLIDSAQTGAMMVALLGLLTILTYIITGIVYLVLDRDTCKEGDRDTDFWIFCLTYSISGLGVGIVANCLCPYRTPPQLEAMAQEEGGVLSREVIRDNDIKILLNFGFLEVASIAFFTAGTLFLNGDLEICADLKKSGLYVWFIISYVMICLSFIFYTIQLVVVSIKLVVDDDVDEKQVLTPVGSTESYQNA